MSLKATLQALDNLNRQDPNTESVDGQNHPKELVYAQRLHHWVLELNPQASEVLQIAARGAHVGRWKSPRSDYEEGRIGYLKWREDLKKYHASEVRRIMQEQGYSQEDQDHATAIILKKSLKDPDTQTLEDALCLVFLEFQFDELIAKTEKDKMIDIIQKTWRKMSETAHARALRLKCYSEQALALIQEALE